MSHDDQPLRQALQALATAPPHDEHPSAEVLLEYHSERLAVTQVEGLRAHLAVCGECAQILLDLGSTGEGEGDDPELDAAWSRLSPRLTPRATAAPASASSPREATPREAVSPAPQGPVSSSMVAVAASARRRSPWPIALAATLGLLVGGALVAILLAQRASQVETLTARIEGLEAQVTELRRPSFGVPSRTLLPDGFLRDETVPTLEISPSTPRIVLVLAGADPLPGASYGLEVVDSQGTPLWQGDALTADARGHFTLVVPVELLQPGEIALRLLDPEAATTVTYRLKIAG